MNIKPMKRFYPLMTILLPFLVVIGSLYVLHLTYVSKISKRHVPDSEIYKRYKVLELAERLGYLKLPPRESSFINFQNKTKEKIRVGVFGDSNTYGAEVSESQNYPAHLQKILGEEYEIINFGMNWYSLDQAYILFDTFYDQMQLDYVVLGPRGLYRQRTTSFNHTDDKEPYYLHSRFVLEDTSGERHVLKEVKPVGQSFSERFERYYAFFPVAQYFIYDTRAPGFLRSLEHYFNVRFMNPFYYFDNISREVKIIHSEILKQFISKAEDKFLFLHNRFEEDELAKTLDWDKSEHMKLKKLRWEGFPWIAQHGHFTGLGNALVAAQASFFFTQEEYETSHIKVIGEYGEWDDREIDVFSKGRKIGKFSLEEDLPNYMIGLNCTGQNIGTTLFYPMTNPPGGASQLSGFQRVYSGEWLTVFTGDDCLVDYQRKELLVDRQYGEDSIVFNNMLLANKTAESVVDGREMFTFAFNKTPARIIVDNSFGEELLSEKEVVIKIR